MSESTTTRPHTSNTVLLWFVENAVLICSFLLAAFFVVDDLEFYLFYEQGLTHILVVTLMMQIGMWLGMLYGSPIAQSRSLLVVVLLRTFGIALLLEALWSYLDPNMQMPPSIMVYGASIALVALPLWRIAFSSVQGKISGTQRLLLIGDSPILGRLKILGETDPVFRVAGVIHADHTSSQIDIFEKVDAALEKVAPTHVVIADNLPYTRDLLNLQWSGLLVLNAAEFYENALRRVPVGELPPGDLLFSPVFRPELPPLLPRVVGALLGILTLPVAAILAIVLRLSGGPVLKRSVRLGRAGKTFLLLQFHVPVEQQAGASRPTRLGRWMGRLGLHRIPELFNVVRGEVAFFGPRPADPAIAKVLEKRLPFFRYRSVVRPGIMGWAQLNLGSGPLDVAEEIAYDLYYIKHQSSILDLYILGRSLVAIRGNA